MNIWEDRRVKIGYDTAENLAKHYNRSNWRDHPDLQKAATGESLDTLGWVDQPKVNIETGNLFDGHLRVELALLKGKKTRIPVDYYELSKEEEKLALLTLDSTTELATVNSDRLVSLMRDAGKLMINIPSTTGPLLGKIKSLRENDDNHNREDGKKSGFNSENFGNIRKIKVVLFVDQLELFERAIMMTGNTNRGNAIIEICKGYINAKRQ